MVYTGKTNTLKHKSISSISIREFHVTIVEYHCGLGGNIIIRLYKWCLCWINLLITGFLLVPRGCSSTCNNTPFQECLVCLS